MYVIERIRVTGYTQIYCENYDQIGLPCSLLFRGCFIAFLLLRTSAFGKFLAIFPVDGPIACDDTTGITRCLYKCIFVAVGVGYDNHALIMWWKRQRAMNDVRASSSREDIWLSISCLGGEPTLRSLMNDIPTNLKQLDASTLGPKLDYRASFALSFFFFRYLRVAYCGVELESSFEVSDIQPHTDKLFYVNILHESDFVQIWIMHRSRNCYIMFCPPFLCPPQLFLVVVSHS